jgi:hypothetical protein
MAITSTEAYLQYLQEIKTYLRGHKKELGNSCPALDTSIKKVDDLIKLLNELKKCYVSAYEQDIRNPIT